MSLRTKLHSRRDEQVDYKHADGETYQAIFQGFVDGRAILMTQDERMVARLKAYGYPDTWGVQISALPEQVTFEDGTHPKPE